MSDNTLEHPINNEITIEKPETKTPAGRLISIDALRGFTMFWIVGGERIFKQISKAWDTPATSEINRQLSHVHWEGFVFYDLIMPMFLFVAGVSMPFAFNKRLERGDSKFKIYLHVIKRVLILFILGMIVQGNLLTFKWNEIRFFSNTLQAIAVGYLITSIAILHLKIAYQAALVAVLLALYWILMMFVPVPGYGAGVLTGDGNLAIYIDKLLLVNHQDQTTYTWILSSITFGATVLIGALAGQWLKSKRNSLIKVAGLIFAGAISVAAGLAWGKFGFPIIKHLWTSSMVLYAAGWSLLALALFYLLIDVFKLKGWAFGFRVLGQNAIAIYVLYALFNPAFAQMAKRTVGGLEQYTGNFYPMIHALAVFMVGWLILLWMYRKKTFLKI